MISDPITLDVMNDTRANALFADVDDNVAASGNMHQLVRTVDFSPGKTVRKGATSADFESDGLTLTIQHAETKENSPFTSTRTQIRLDAKRTNSVTGKPVVASVYTIFVHPSGGNFSVNDMQRLHRALALFLLFGQRGNGQTYTEGEATLVRILNGEP
jgi:hypothetical protein